MMIKDNTNSNDNDGAIITVVVAVIIMRSIVCGILACCR